MARYRKIAPGMWGDKTFRRLSGSGPCGQTLWIYLLTGPHTNIIPGLFRATQEGMAAELGWAPEAFREAFREVTSNGLCEADWDAHVVSIKNVIKYDEPQAPNVVKAWRKAADEIPECGLKTRHLLSLYAFLQGKGKAFAKAFVEAFGEPSAMAFEEHSPPEPSPEPSPKDQDPTDLEGGSPPPAPLELFPQEPPRFKRSSKDGEAKAQAFLEPFLDVLLTKCPARFAMVDLPVGKPLWVLRAHAQKHERAEWETLGEWLAAGGDAYRESLSCQDLSWRFPDLLAKALLWDSEGRRSFVKTAPQRRGGVIDPPPGM